MLVLRSRGDQKRLRDRMPMRMRRPAGVLPLPTVRDALQVRTAGLAEGSAGGDRGAAGAEGGMIRIKEGVDLRELQPQMVLAAVVAAPVFKAHGHDVTITSAFDGKHMANTLHSRDGKCRALDLRTVTAGIPAKEAETIGAGLRLALGKQFDVVVEKDHIHVEFDPKEAA